MGDLAGERQTVVTVGEESADLVLKILSGGKGADLDKADLAVLCNEDGGRKDADLEKAQRVPGQAHRKAEPVRGLIVGDHLHGIRRVAGDRQDDHPVAVRLIAFLHLRELHLTGPAPTGKDIEDDQVLLLQKLRECGGRAVGQRDRKVRKGLTGFNAEPAGICISGAHQRCQHQYGQQNSDCFFHI